MAVSSVRPNAPLPKYCTRIKKEKEKKFSLEIYSIQTITVLPKQKKRDLKYLYILHNIYKSFIVIAVSDIRKTIYK